MKNIKTYLNNNEIKFEDEKTGSYSPYVKFMREQIQKLLDSDLSSLHIAKQTDVEQSTIYRLRKGERSLDNLGLSKAEKLYEFATILFSSEDDEKQNLLVKRASIMGMLANLEMTDEESNKLNEEKIEIEYKLDKLMNS